MFPYPLEWRWLAGQYIFTCCRSEPYCTIIEFHPWWFATFTKVLLFLHEFFIICYTYWCSELILFAYFVECQEQSYNPVYKYNAIASKQRCRSCMPYMCVCVCVLSLYRDIFKRSRRKVCIGFARKPRLMYSSYLQQSVKFIFKRENE